MWNEVREMIAVAGGNALQAIEGIEYESSPVVLILLVVLGAFALFKVVSWVGRCVIVLVILLLSASILGGDALAPATEWLQQKFSIA